MRKTLAGGFVLAALILTVGTQPPEVAVAQAKKVDKAGKEAKAKKETAAKGGVIEIAKGKDDKYRFFVRDGDGKLLAMSGPGGFATVKDAEDAIDQLKEVVARAKVSPVDK